jgi:hypothetical protein
MRSDEAFLDKQRIIGDAPADALVNRYFSENRQRELYQVLQLPEQEIRQNRTSSPLHHFIAGKKKSPAWFDELRLLRGQQVFKSYASDIMMLLGAMALPYCYAASPGNKALYLSEKMRQNPAKRLLDTANFVIGVSTPGSLLKEGNGHMQINRTRLIHAIARYYILKGEWTMAWGLPINQEDMAGTNLAFSAVTLIGLQQSGIILSTREREDFIYLWRYIGYQLNIQSELLPADFNEAYTLAMRIKKRNFRKSDEGIALTRELLNYYKSVAPPEQVRLIDAQVRNLVGDEVARYIGLEPDYLRDRISLVFQEFTTLQNLFKVHTISYSRMMENHERLKQLIITGQS